MEAAIATTPMEFGKAKAQKSDSECAELTARIDRIMCGDSAAQEWFYKRFSPTIYRRIRRRFGAHPTIDCDGLLHDLFLWCFKNDARVLQKFLDKNDASLRTEFRLEGYLWGLVSGLVANQRRVARDPSNEVDYESVDSHDALRIDSSVEERDVVKRLTECIRQRGVRIFLYFTLRFVEGLTPQEVESVTGWPRTKIYKLKSAFARSVKFCVAQLGL